MKVKLRWLAFAVLLTALISSVTFSRYMTVITGSGTAIVAEISMSGSFQGSETNLNLEGLAPGISKEITFSIVNYSGDPTNPQVSDVAQSYSICLESTGNLPLVYTLTAQAPAVGQGTAATPWIGAWQPAVSAGTATGTTAEIITAAEGILPHTVASTHTYTLAVSWPAEKNQTIYSEEVDAVTLRVESKQVEPK